MLAVSIGGDSQGLVQACEKSKRSLNDLSRYSSITGKSFKKMSRMIDSAISSLGDFTSALATGDVTQMSQAVQGLTLNTKGFSTILAKVNPNVASFTRNLGGLLGKIGLIAGLLGLLGKGISDAVNKAKELREQRFNEEWERQHVSLSKYSEKIADHIVELERLKNTVHNTNASLKDRRDAITKLNEITGDYTAKISNEGRVYNENSRSLETYIGKLFKYYTALAWKDKWIESIKKGIDAQLELEKATQKVKDAQKGVDDMNKNYNNSYIASGPGATAGGSWMGSGQDIALHSTVGALQDAKKEQAKAEKEVAKFDKEQKNLQEKFLEAENAVGDFNPDGPKKSNPKGGGGGSNKPQVINTQPLVIKGDREGPILDSLFPKSIEGVDARIKAYTDLYNKALDDATRQLAKSKIEYWQKQKDIMENGPMQPIKIDMPKLEFGKNEFASEVDGWSEKLKSKLLDLHIDLQDGIIDQEQFEAGVAQLRRIQAILDEMGKGGAFLTLSEGFNTLGSSISQFSNKAAKAAGTAIQAVGALFQVIGQVIAYGGAKALAHDLGLGFPANIPAIATTIGLIATVTSTISSLAGMKFANGGIVGGGSYSGDQLTAQVNSGEMILNRTQQTRLFSMLNGHGSSNIMEGGKVEFEIKGKRLVGVLANYSKQQNKL